ncbi:MAG: hypothetical protein U0694_01115 [Anaerolineae bacterium]
MQQFGGVPIRLMLFLLMCQSGIMTGVQFFKTDDDLYNPIAAYPLLMPGAPLSALEAYSCRWQNEGAGRDIISTCSNLLGNPYFPGMDVYASRNVIMSIAFQVNGLRVGDMPVEWGRPHVQPYGETFSVYWLFEGYCITAYLQPRPRFTYWAAINYLTIRSC